MYQNDLVAVAKRDGNKKRGYLLVNRLQGKHLPVRPSRALHLFSTLAETLPFKKNQENLLVIGFAETATAIGAHVAIFLGAQYIQTTRESFDEKFLSFSEEHSHATEQKLLRAGLDQKIRDFDTILFVEDEITTGKTIRNIVKKIQISYGSRFDFHVASILNGMSEKDALLLNQEGIIPHCLFRADHTYYTDSFPEDLILEKGHNYRLFPEFSSPDFPNIANAHICAGGKINPRKLCHAAEYQRDCEKIKETLLKTFESSPSEKTLILGTEECMYPAIFIGAELEKRGYTVFTQSTTRSPIFPSSDPGYPIGKRYEISSPYEKERETFLYNLEEYSRIYVVTDAKGKGTLIPALRHSGCKKIHWVQIGGEQ